ncbi:hypothetical protein AKJ16_DCAP17079 [Drosera capensis]
MFPCCDEIAKSGKNFEPKLPIWAVQSKNHAVFRRGIIGNSHFLEENGYPSNLSSGVQQGAINVRQFDDELMKNCIRSDYGDCVYWLICVFGGLGLRLGFDLMTSSMI